MQARALRSEPGGPGGRYPGTPLGLEQLLLSLRLGSLIVPWAMLALSGWSAARLAVQIDVVIALDCALIWALLSRHPEQVIRWQPALRLLDVAIVFLAFRIAHPVLGDTSYDALYLPVVIAAAATHGRRGAYGSAAVATLAVILGHVQPTFDGSLRLHPRDIADTLVAALVFVASGSITCSVQQRSGKITARPQLHDPVTALPARILFEDRLEQGLLAAQRTNMPLALLVLEMSQAQHITETSGNGLIQQVAQRLQDHLRGGDTVARLDQDLFAVVLPRTDEMGATRAAKKLGAWLRRPFALNGRQVNLEAHIGVSGYPHHGSEAALLLERATTAMQLAKQTGRGYVVYDVTTEPLDLHGTAFQAAEA